MNISINSTYMWVPDSKFEAHVPVTVIDIRRKDFKLDNGWTVNPFGVAEGTKSAPGGRIIELTEAKEILVEVMSFHFPKLTISLREHEGELDMMIAEGEEEAMPDGSKIFLGDYDDYDDTHPNRVHVAFEACLLSNGFYLERYDESWWMPTPVDSATELAAYRRVMKAISFDVESIPF